MEASGSEKWRKELGIYLLFWEFLHFGMWTGNIKGKETFNKIQIYLFKFGNTEICGNGLLLKMLEYFVYYIYIVDSFFLCFSKFLQCLPSVW